MKNKIVFLFGTICSGKTTLAKSKYKKYTYIKVSDIVKKLTGGETRQELQNTSSFDTQIANELLQEILTNTLTTNKVVVDGIRQPSIIELLLRKLAKTADIELVWLDTPLDECRLRFYERAHQSEKDSTDTFEDAVLRDDELGLNYIRLLYKQQLQYESTQTNQAQTS